MKKKLSNFQKILQQISEPLDFCKEDGESMISNLKGTTMDGYELIDSRVCGEEPEDVDAWVKSLVNLESIKQNANDKSRLDKNEFKVRYSYDEVISSTNSRDFCKEMMGRTRRGVVYRLEDINMASTQGINKSHGHKGRNYSLWKYKGGVHCHHVWKSHLYRLKTDQYGNPVTDKALSSSEEIQPYQTWYSPKPAGLADAEKAPVNMPRNGHHPNWGK